VETAKRARAVAVLPFVDAAGRRSADGVAATQQLTTELANREVPVVDQAVLAEALRGLGIKTSFTANEPLLQRVGMTVGASLVLTGKIMPRGERADAQLRAIDVASGRVALAATVGLAAASGGAVVPGAVMDGPPPENRVIAEDEHLCTVGGWSRARGNPFKLSIAPDKPKVKMLDTSISFRLGFKTVQPGQVLTVSVSSDYGKTWTVVDKYDIAKLKEIQRNKNWWHITLRDAGASRTDKRKLRESDIEVDELQVNFGMGYGHSCSIHTVVWWR
jgi:TolB-like protein